MNSQPVDELNSENQTSSNEVTEKCHMFELQKYVMLVILPQTFLIRLSKVYHKRRPESKSDAQTAICWGIMH